MLLYSFKTEFCFKDNWSLPKKRFHFSYSKRRYSIFKNFKWTEHMTSPLIDIDPSIFRRINSIQSIQCNCSKVQQWWSLESSLKLQWLFLVTTNAGKCAGVQYAGTRALLPGRPNMNTFKISWTILARKKAIIGVDFTLISEELFRHLSNATKEDPEFSDHQSNLIASRLVSFDRWIQCHDAKLSNSMEHAKISSIWWPQMKSCNWDEIQISVKKKILVFCQNDETKKYYI